VQIDHVGVKIFARDGARVHWPDLIPVFHRWIQRQTFPEMLPIDVADYAHVPAGPGVLLIGHHGDVALDNRANRLGVAYRRKTAMDGTFSGKLKHAHACALAAARQLESEPELRGNIEFDDSDLEITINDRLIAPNTPETWESVRSDIEQAFPGAHFDWNNNPKELFRVRVKRQS
jgi:hypothetical protein